MVCAHRVGRTVEQCVVFLPSILLVLVLSGCLPVAEETLKDGSGDVASQEVVDLTVPDQGGMDLLPDQVTKDTLEVSGDLELLDATELTPGFCGDEVCSEAEGEDCENCSVDCGACGTTCGNCLCEAGLPVENPQTCPEDCGSCGDGGAAGTECVVAASRALPTSAQRTVLQPVAMGIAR